ncbi:MAG: HAD-IIIC family phosphatase [Phycisphaerales bacterium]
MIHREKVIVMDLDGTLCGRKAEGESYADVEPRTEVLEQLRRYRAEGFYVVIATARNMRTFDGNLGKVNANTLPVIIEWLKKHDVPYDELHVGKPWQGRGGFYVDDKAIRPDEFVRMSYEDVMRVVGSE